ncbi:MAG: methyltransferase domain-containing protein [Myxococcota bacterium]
MQTSEASEQGSVDSLQQAVEIFQCPRCRGGDLSLAGSGLRCRACAHDFEVSDDIPMLFWPNEEGAVKGDVTEVVKAFYEETPFPDYDDFDSVASLSQKARQGMFARLLDEQIPPATRILEVGCGTGQMSNFLSVANRTVFATDVCMNSLRLGQQFARAHQLRRVRFVQMNLFRPAFKPGSFHLVWSNGVLHHTADPRLAFKTIAQLVRPGGYILIGLYHRYGRLITDARRAIFRISGDRFKSLDPNLRSVETSDAKRRAWFADQYKHPHESKHTIGETLKWLREVGFSFVKSIPPSKPFRTFSETERLFEAELPGNAFERLLVELGMTFKGSREGGFFIVVAKRPR